MQLLFALKKLPFILLLAACQEPALKVQYHARLHDPSPQGEIISGGSGLVKHGEYFFVIRDNSNFIYKFQAPSFKMVQSIPIFPGALPLDQKKRKKVKPDLEAQVILPGQNSPDKLLLIPSGSKKNRTRGAWLSFSAPGELEPHVHPVDFSLLYLELKSKFKKVNIEGAAVSQQKLLLFQRGNSKKSRNAIVYLDLKCLMPATEIFKPTPECIEKIIYPKLGFNHSIPYTFTDAKALDSGEIFFLAAAEETDDAVADGDVSGAIIGQLDQASEVLWSKSLDQKIKFEGLELISSTQKNSWKFYLLSDADSDEIPSEIYILEFER